MPLALLLLLGGMLAACGDLPHPFQPADKSTKAWSRPGDVAWGSILVPPIRGLPAAQSAALMDEVVEALHLRDVPASTRTAGRGSIVLAGNIARVSGKLRWTLVTPDGETVLRFDEPIAGVSSDDAGALDLAAIAARAARRVSAALKLPATDDTKTAPRVPVVLETVRGAPGDGGIALARAMRHSLARIGVSIADAPGKESLSILGRVSVARGDTAASGATVTIAWDVFLPDGRRLGTVSQSNRVAAEQLTGTWGVLPKAVARAGAPGIAQLLRQAKASLVAQSPRREEPRREAATEPPLGLHVESRLLPAELPSKAPHRPPTTAPFALLIEASSTPSTALTEPPPLPIPKPLPTPRLKPRPEAPAAPAVVVEAPITVSVTVQ